jgi:asparagine synthetase B (glutamine-hydrolysing)
MPILAGWITGEQVPQDIIEQTLMTMREVLAQHGGEAAWTVQPGTGLVAFSDTAYAMQHNDEAPVLDWVPDRRTLVYRRPLSGQHPLYFIENWPAEGNLLFASEIKALFAVGVPRRLHLTALDALLRYGFIPAPWTAFKDIQVVPAGSILRWQRAKTVLNASTDYHLEEASQLSDVADQLYALLDEVSAAQLPPHEQLVALSSGGPSSALATLLAAQHTTTQFPIAAFGNIKSISAKAWQAAEQVANACQHPFLAITGVDQSEFWAAALAGIEAPAFDTRALALHQLLHTAATETAARVALSGLGASPLSGNQFTEQAVREHMGQDMLAQYGQLLNKHSGQETAKLWTPEVQEQLKAEERWEDTLHARKLARKAGLFADKQQGYYYLDLHLRLPDQIVGPAQQLAAQEQLALRSPYLHARVIDKLAHLPQQLDNGVSKHTLLATLLARHYTNDNSNPNRLTLTVPTTSLTGPADTEILQQTLSGEALRATGIFDVQAVEELLKQGKKAAKKELVFVFTTQLLCKMFEATVQ